jgi:hypothetical protein
MRRAITVFILGCFAATVGAQSVSELFASGARVRGMVIPIFDKKAMTNLVVIRVERVYTAHERKGFFQIGLLPVEVLEGVTIQVTQPERLTNSMERIDRWMSPKKSDCVELRDTRIEVGSQWLEAKRIRPGGGGVWELLDGVAFNQGTNTIRSAQGRLQLAGLRAGEVTLVTETNRYYFSIPAPVTSISNAASPVNRPSQPVLPSR